MTRWSAIRSVRLVPVAVGHDHTNEPTAERRPRWLAASTGSTAQ
jgi:hypothetical protein